MGKMGPSERKGREYEGKKQRNTERGGDMSVLERE